LKIDHLLYLAFLAFAAKQTCDILKNIKRLNQMSYGDLSLLYFHIFAISLISTLFELNL